jgi:hypothetical protein
VCSRHKKPAAAVAAGRSHAIRFVLRETTRAINHRDKCATVVSRSSLKVNVYSQQAKELEKGADKLAQLRHQFGASLYNLSEDEDE